MLPESTGHSHDHGFSLARKIDSYSSTLSERERLILAAILVQMMDPIDMMRFKKISSILEIHEIEVLKKISEQSKKE